MLRRTSIFLLIILCLSLSLSACAPSGPKVAVLSVSEILGIGPIGMVDRYAGIVEASDTINIDKDNEMTVAEITVKPGDSVAKGQVLFSYDTSSLSIELERMQLELEQLNSNITTKKSQLATLEKEQQTAAAGEKLQYTLQIQQLQIDIKEAEYNVVAKQKEVNRAKTRLADANVLSPVDGQIKSVQSGADSYDSSTGQPLPFISISQEGDYRVRGTVNEQNAANFSIGLPVIIRARTDTLTTWTGTVTEIDWSNPVQNNNNYYYGPTDEMSTTTKYPFYIELDSDLGLMLGQHVYVEPNAGQNNSEYGETFYLPSYYICDLDSAPWVWAANEKDKLEQRSVLLGNYNIDLDSYEILEGLALEDYIAMPDESCVKGAPVSYPGEDDLIIDDLPADFDEFPEPADDNWNDGDMDAWFDPEDDAFFDPELVALPETEAVG